MTPVSSLSLVLLAQQAPGLRINDLMRQPDLAEGRPHWHIAVPIAAYALTFLVSGQRMMQTPISSRAEWLEKYPGALRDFITFFTIPLSLYFSQGASPSSYIPEVIAAIGLGLSLTHRFQKR